MSTPVSPAAPTVKATVPGAVWVFLLLLAAGQGYLIYKVDTRPDPAPPANVVDGKAVGKALLAALPAVEAARLRAMRDAALAGKPMADVMAAGEAARHDADSKLRAAVLAPALTKLVPEGTEPKDPAARAEFAAAVGAMADAIDGGKK